jgi:hypothetical protein
LPSGVFLPTRLAIITFIAACGLVAAWALLGSGATVLAEDDSPGGRTKLRALR